MTLARLADLAFDIADRKVPCVPGSRCAADPKHDDRLHLVQAYAVETLLLAVPDLSAWSALDMLGIAKAEDAGRAMSSPAFDPDLPERLAGILFRSAQPRAA